jgi:oxygen-independent coproporphyrinogen-3 oxidase
MILAGLPRIDALYAHMPFCFHKCHYCDFYSIVEPDHRALDRHAAFMRRLIEELRHRASQMALKPSTLFVGGGTPTLLSVDLWRAYLAALAECGALQNLQEFTVEANPETLTAELAKLLVAGGVDRLSIGAQSFHPPLLKTLERWHEPASVARAVAIAREAGIRRLNLDLIFAIPGQDLALLEADLDAALALQPDHLSYYNLTYEPNTAMTQRLKLGQVQPIDEDLERAMYGRIMQRLGDAGFEHYEISNWAKPGQQCRHNLHYWHNANWLAIGPSGASHVNGHRWRNDPHLGRYLEQRPEPPTIDHEQLPPDRSLGEQLMLRLRLIAGAELTWLHQHVPPENPRWGIIDELLAIDMLERTASHLRLSERGVYVGDAVIAKLL